MQNLSACAASLGNSSETWMPATLVAIGLNSPRISAGASGLGSNVSCCGGPPVRNRTTHRFARPNPPPAGAEEAARRYDASVSPPTAPRRSTVRRVGAACGMCGASAGPSGLRRALTRPTKTALLERAGGGGGPREVVRRFHFLLLASAVAEDVQHPHPAQVGELRLRVRVRP